MKKKRFLTAWLAASLLLAVIVPAASAAESQPAAPEHYVVLGDSLAIGYEPGMKADTVSYGYADRLYEQSLRRGRTMMTNYGISGLSSEGLRNFVQSVVDQKQVKGSELQPRLPDQRSVGITDRPKQVRADIESATFITLTIGGNDFKDDIDEFLTYSDAEFQAYMNKKMETFTNNVTDALTKLFTLNPKVRLYLADQYQPAPNLSLYKAYYDKFEPVKKAFTSTLKQLEEKFRKDKFDLHIVPISEAFVGSEGLYVHIAVRDIHPTQEGYKKMAEVFAKSIWGEYWPEPAAVDPITVMVKGKLVDTVHMPTLLNGSTFVPLREYSEALGAKVDWNDATKTATVSFKGGSVELTIDSTSIVVNGAVKPIDTPAPYYYESAGESKTYIPLRLMAEGLGFDVQYVQQSRTAYINP